MTRTKPTNSISIGTHRPHRLSVRFPTSLHSRPIRWKFACWSTAIWCTMWPWAIYNWSPQSVTFILQQPHRNSFRRTFVSKVWKTNRMRTMGRQEAHRRVAPAASMISPTNEYWRSSTKSKKSKHKINVVSWLRHRLRERRRQQQWQPTYQRLWRTTNPSYLSMPTIASANFYHCHAPTNRHAFSGHAHCRSPKRNCPPKNRSA